VSNLAQTAARLSLHLEFVTREAETFYQALDLSMSRVSREKRFVQKTDVVEGFPISAIH
jgi:hypothetical protein